MLTLQLLKGLYMRRYINQNEIDGIVVDDIQSFTRNHKVLLEIFADMKKRNIKPIGLNTSCEGLYEAYKSNYVGRNDKLLNTGIKNESSNRNR